MKNKMALKTLIMAFAVAIAGVILFAASYYTSESYMTLNGDSKVVVGLNGVYDDPGATAVIHGRDVSDEVTVSGEPDWERPGKYTVVYRAGNFSVERYITVMNQMDPVITLEGAEDQTSVKLGEEYTEPGYEATDSEGNDITSAVKVSGNEFKRAGTNRITYTVSDSEGKTTRVYRTVEVEPNTEYSTSGIPVCMYHYVYDENDPPVTVNANYISTSDLQEEMAWLNEQGYYYPTWNELRDYIDGKILLPEKSVIITFDDAALSFFKLGLPILEQNKIPATCFIVTSKNAEAKMEKYQSAYLEFQSHSDDMHRGGGNIGHGGIFTVMSHDDALADLKKSIEITGHSEAFAYPYGDYNDACKEVVEEAGFLCALTTRQGRVKPGDDPMSLARQRMSRNQTMETFRALVLPY